MSILNQTNGKLYQLRVLETRKSMNVVKKFIPICNYLFLNLTQIIHISIWFYFTSTFHIKMRRKGGFYNYILVLPCVLLSCLTSVIF